MGRPLDILYAAGAIVSAPAWGFNLLRTGKWRTDWAGRFGRGPAITDSGTAGGCGDAKPQAYSGGAAGSGGGGCGGRLLIHAVSVGEVNATRALIDTLRAQRPDLTLILSATTNTGFARAVQLFADTLHVVRYPLDFTGSVRRFLDRVQPDAVALMELEVWPNFIQQCDRRRIPVCVINGRLTERSFRRYQRLGPLIYRAFGQLAAAGVQTPAYADRFAALGVPHDRLHVLDTMKWDTAPGSSTPQHACGLAPSLDGAEELAGQLGIDRGKPLIVAGSTGPGEEKILLDAKPPGVQLLIAPRKPERFNEVAALDPHFIRRTQPIAPRQAPIENFLLDTLGELRKAYALADVVIVGRSFNPTARMGGSDPIEPAAMGKAVVIGRDVYNFESVVEALLAGGGIVVSEDPMTAAMKLLGDRDRAAQLSERAREVIAQHRGATRRYAEMVLALVDAARSPSGRG